MINHILPYRRWIIVALHASLVAVGYWLAYLLRFEFPLSPADWRQFLVTLPLILIVRLTVFAWLHLYEGLWRYVSMRDILAILKAVTLSSVVFAFAVLGLINPNFPWPIFPIDWGVCLLLVGGTRLALRAAWEWRARSRNGGERRALIIGAGDAGELLIREIGRNPGLNYHIVGFVDDDPSKQGRRIHGIEVVGTIDQLPDLCLSREVQELLIAIPSATGAEMRRIIGACRAARVEYRTVPSLAELMEGPLTVSKVRRVDISDLLRREPVKIDHANVESFVQGKRVLVTGAGGSIGSELCRQLARFGPEKIVLVERAENNLFFVEMELREKFPQVPLCPVIGDVTDERRMATIFGEHKPQVVFHAAAHKHVPLMEQNKGEAVKNNVLGTMVVANAAERIGVEDFVLISTDKAVRPSSVMGATKRLTEMYVQALNAQAKTRFLTVRFGNVLGSEGSVLQVFQRQIEAGGPLTITHPDMRRYFMTIPEACQLVLQAATQGEGGQIFVLDMGEPVRIVDLARDLIVLSGLDPEKDIEIKFTEPRPGEKLFEELLNPETRILPTAHEKILVVETDSLGYGSLHVGILELLKYAEAGEETLLLAKLRTLVPDYENGVASGPRQPEKAHRILLVEDDPYTRMTLKRILESRYQVFEAENRREALLRLRERKPDLVILDFHLPGANIRRLCAKIKAETGGSEGGGARGLGSGRDGKRTGEEAARSRRPAIIILAESSSVANFQDILALGADDRLYRPIPVNILESRVQRLLRREDVRPDRVVDPQAS